MKIAIAGSTGFIGANLVHELLKSGEHTVVALSRHKGVSEHERLEVRQCDLYSMLEAENALEGCDVGIYLVHSMAPASSRLTQGNFRDFDFLLADNFARAAKKNGLRQIIYVSGLVPQTAHLSTHLASRLEVERTLQHWEIPLTTFRCGLVIGPKGSSFQILDKLIDRLPTMLTPKWMDTKTQVVFVDDLVQIILKAIDAGPNLAGSFDVACEDIISYKTLLKITMRVKNKEARLIPLPYIPLALSKFWIHFITGTPRNLVYPLVESLTHEMLCSSARALPEDLRIPLTSIEDAVEKSLSTDRRPPLPASFTRNPVEKISEVQSVQRLPLPPGWSSKEVAQAYLRWLPLFLKTWISATTENDTASMYFLFFKNPLLVLSLSVDRSFRERQLFYITGGSLVDLSSKGRFEFRESPDKFFVIAAIHRFRPRLPWYVYRFTQALVHQFVMIQFGRYLKHKKTLSSPPPVSTRTS
jgi:uncharacterized protein YbjT (DUF2867 family)